MQVNLPLGLVQEVEEAAHTVTRAALNDDGDGFHTALFNFSELIDSVYENSYKPIMLTLFAHEMLNHL